MPAKKPQGNSRQPSPSLEERVTALENQLAQLQSEVKRLAPEPDWRSTIGMFAGDEVMREIVEEGRKIREKDRERARRRYGKGRQSKTKS